MVFVVEAVAVEIELEVAVIGRQMDDLHAFDEFFARAPVGDEALDRAELQAVLRLEADRGRAGGPSCRRR